MPRYHILHVDVRVVPQCQDILVQLLSSAGQGRKSEITYSIAVSQNQEKTLHWNKRMHKMNPNISPCGHINSFSVGRRHSETNRGHHGLIPRRVDDFPLSPVRVTGQHTLVVFIDVDLKELWQRHRQRFTVKLSNKIKSGVMMCWDPVCTSIWR